MGDVLDDAAVDESVAELTWERDGNKLVKVLTFRDFAEAMRYVNAVADVAERENHHPDIAIQWNQVTLTLWTHSQGGITDKDLGMARTLEGVPAP